MTTTVNEEAVGAFVGRVLGDTSAAAVTVMAAIGDRLGLFKELARGGPATSGELAVRAGVVERYVREWANGMTAAGYIQHDEATGRYSLPDEHVPALAQEGGPAFFGGVHEELLGAIAVYENVVEAFRTGGGVSIDSYPAQLHEGVDRFTSGWFENLLLPVWVPTIAGLTDRLEQGIDVLDVGCGRGRALIRLAKRFPRSRFTGVDVHVPSIQAAIANAEAEGVGGAVRFERLDASQNLPQGFNLVTTFDVVHDAVNPLGILKRIRRSLKPDGLYLCLEVNCSDSLAENAGPIGALLYGFSILYCMTTSMAGGGAGYGTLGLHQKALTELASEAGFSSTVKVPLDNPFNNLYEIRP